VISIPGSSFCAQKLEALHVEKEAIMNIHKLTQLKKR